MSTSDELLRQCWLSGQIDASQMPDEIKGMIMADQSPHANEAPNTAAESAIAAYRQVERLRKEGEDRRAKIAQDELRIERTR
jgi:hypothetical protein